MLVGAGVHALAVGHGRIWTIDFNGRTVQATDPATGADGGVVALPSNPTALAVDEQAVWVLCRARHALVRVDPIAMECNARIEVGRGHGSIVADGDVWVTHSTDGTVTQVSADPSIAAVRTAAEAALGAIKGGLVGNG